MAGKGKTPFIFRTLPLNLDSNDHAVTLCAFDLLEIDGSDLRCESIEKRKDRLRDLLRRSHPGIAFNDHYADDGAIIYKHACALGCESFPSGSARRIGQADRTTGSRSRTQ